jgi:glycosyltransferase involved in cell wall biosynthesis/4-amino-4-deoxy-L-arabinose transferase-like glycosyltransferase
MRFVYFGIYDPEFSRNRIYMRALRAAGHEIVECRDTSPGPMKYARLAWRLLSLRGTYDALIVGYPGHVTVPIARLFSRAPVIVDFLGSFSDALAHSHGASRFKKWIFTIVDWLAIWCADRVLVESEAQKNYLISRFGRAKSYAVIYTGVDESVFFKEKGKEQNQKFVVLFRGRLTPESGIVHILEAAHLLKAQSDIEFRIVGYGHLLKHVEHAIREKNLTNVQLISTHLSFDEMREYISDADVSLGQFENNPRLDRTIPHKAFESAVMGIPYITGYSDAVREIFSDAAFCMLEKANPRAIADAIIALKNDPEKRKQLAVNAHSEYEKHASQSAIMRKIITSIPSLHRRAMYLLPLLLIVFALIRLPGLDLPFHQDEWKNAHMVRVGIEGGLSAHPPLMELIYVWSGAIFGADNLRLMPLVFGVISAWLLYIVMRRRVSASAAAWATGLYAISMYGVLASLMLDMDGTILPAFFLAAVYAYDRFSDAETTRGKLGWLGALFGAVALGFMTKLSFVLVPAAILLDYLWHMRNRFTARFVASAAGFFVLGAGVLTAALILADRLMPAFDIGPTISHATSYIRFEGRGYMQIVIQAVKALFYLSPLLLLAPLFVNKDLLDRSRIFVIYGALGFVFYFILFDFSQGALDKYLMYSIVPLVALSGSAITRVLGGHVRREALSGVILGGVISTALIAISYLPHDVIPLYPKTAFVDAVVSRHWNILMPFTGGNGPLGFYMSFLLMAMAFIASFIIVTIGWFKKRFEVTAIVALLVIGLVYNALFIQEYFWGNLYGSAPRVLHEALVYIGSNNEITSVITHADAGAYELNTMGKYTGRFYAVPAYAEGHRELFSKHAGQYLVVDMPLLNQSGFYRSFFNTCTPLFETHSGVIKGYVYDCADSDPYAIP